MEQQKHILIVDDVSTNLKCEGEVLKGKYRVSMAKSGEQALKMMEKSKPDMILLDINMPAMDGYETMAKIKENPVYADIPVILLTGDSGRESRNKSFEMGAADYIRKPIHPDRMLEKIDRIFKKRTSFP